jgi:hypothetical protein
MIAPDALQPKAYFATLIYLVQLSFRSPVSLIKRQSTLTEAVLMTAGSTIEFPKT